MEATFFTINACNRCRRRKARCDTRIPTCVPCHNAGAVCEFTDPKSKTTLARAVIAQLERDLHALEVEQRKLSASPTGTAPDLSRREADGPGTPTAAPSSSAPASAKAEQSDLILLDAGGDAHFLGVSSGVHLARSILESASRRDSVFNTITSSKEPAKQSKPSSQASSSRGAAQSTSLPSWETAENLIDVFFTQYHVQYPILDQKQFVGQVRHFYERGPVRDGTYEHVRIAFMINIVFSIALQYLSRTHEDAAGLSERFHANAMADLPYIMRRKDVCTIQCLLLILVSVFLRASSSPVWYISGLSMRMCVDLGLHTESTIRLSAAGFPTPEEVELKRRLFWVAFSFDRTLSVILGRPFTLEDDRIDVAFPSPAESLPDRQITHWFKLQKLQSEFVSRLYTKKDFGHDDSQQRDLSAWIADMARQLAQWMDEASLLADPNGLTVDWWRYWYHNVLLLLYRPSPNNPKLTAESSSTCYAAAKNMIQSSFVRLHKGAMDFTWVDMHYQFIGGITLLFLIWDSPEARARATNEWMTFKSCLVQWELVLERMAGRWTHVGRAREIMGKLADATVRVVEREITKASRSTTAMMTRPARVASIASRDWEKHRSIMEQLGRATAQGSSSTVSSTSPLPVLSQHPITLPPLQNLSPQQQQQQQQQQQYHPEIPQPSTSVDLRPMIISPPQGSDSVSPVPWIYGGQLLDPTAAPLPLPPELASVFAGQDDLWPGIGAYDGSMMTGNMMTGTLGRFEHFPLGTGANTAVDDAVMAGMPGFYDHAWTQSVLNFHDPWDGGP